MAEYWVGPSLRQRQRPPRWTAPDSPRAAGLPVRTDRVRARPLTPRRWRALARLTNIKLHDVHFLSRHTAHIVVSVLVIVAALAYDEDFRAILHLYPTVAQVEAPETIEWATTSDESPAALTWSAVPETIIPERPAIARTEPIIYEVREGDNPTIVAARFGLTPDTVIWANSAGENPELLAVGQTLVLPPMDGMVHIVTETDTIAALAETYSGDAAAIVAFAGNNISLDDQRLVVGQNVVIPGGVKPAPPPPPPVVVAPPPAPPVAAAPPRPSNPAPVAPVAPVAPAAAAPVVPTYVGATGAFRWPVRGRITQGSSYRHTALDIATSLGTPIAAADGGRVVFAGWDNTGYGYCIIISHGNGLWTLYAHMSRYYMDYGDYVNKGDIIGRVGSTGNSSGPHLHFEVRTSRSGGRQNPWNYLP